ncbi:MAG: hypothetical protein R3C44_23385 [Chloroflexota bacterium]
MMTRLTRTLLVVITILFVVAIAAACTSTGADSEATSTTPGFLPQPGDYALVFTHRFNEGDYDTLPANPQR